MTKTQLFGIPFDDGSIEEAVSAALCLIGRREAAYAVTPNPEIVLAARKDPALMRAVTEADLILPDGVGLVYASRILGKALKHRVPGVDFASALMAALGEKKGSVFFLGAGPGVAESAAARLRALYPGLRVAGMQHGYFSADEEPHILEQICASQPDLLIVCLGLPRQELWMSEHTRLLPVGLMVGLGGALDVYSGHVARAPEALRRLGLEWAYRLWTEPRRIRRAVRLPGILWAAWKERSRRKR